MGITKSTIFGQEPFITPARSPGGLGINDAADPDANMCVMGDTPGSVGVGGDFGDSDPPDDSPPPSDVPLLVFDLPCVYHFLKSVAMAKAQQQYTRIQWQEFKAEPDSDGKTDWRDEVVDFFYDLNNALHFTAPNFLGPLASFIPGVAGEGAAKPGSAEVIQGSPREVKQRAEQDVDALFESFLHRSAEGPAKALAYLEGQQKIREGALQAVQATFADAQVINQDVLNKLGTVVKAVSGIKCGADLIMTGVGLAAGGIPAFLVGLGYSVTKEWAKGGDAKAVGLKGLSKGVKKGAKEGGKKLGEKVNDKMISEGKDLEEAIARKEGLIEKYERALANKAAGSGKASSLATRIALRKEELADLEKAALGRRIAGKGAKFAGKSLKWVFAAKDVYDSVTELIKNWKEAE